MTYTYELSQSEYRRAKTALTRAVNGGDPAKILATVRSARLLFDHRGYPDSWANWPRALHDISYQREHFELWQAVGDELEEWN